MQQYQWVIDEIIQFNISSFRNTMQWWSMRFNKIIAVQKIVLFMGAVKMLNGNIIGISFTSVLIMFMKYTPKNLTTTTTIDLESDMNWQLNNSGKKLSFSFLGKKQFRRNLTWIFASPSGIFSQWTWTLQACTHISTKQIGLIHITILILMWMLRISVNQPFKRII